jgi:hypothetical protein
MNFSCDTILHQQSNSFPVHNLLEDHIHYIDAIPISTFIEILDYLKK